MMCSVCGDRIDREDMNTLLSAKHPVCFDCMKDPGKRETAREQITLYHPEMLEVFERIM